MIRPTPPRQVERSAAGQPTRPARPVTDLSFPAPIRGLVQAGSPLEGDPAAADVLENFLPTAEGARLRGGAAAYATLGGPARALLTYRSGTQEAFFGATSTAIRPLTAVADPNVAPAASVSGLTAGDWSSVQFSSPGGSFLVIANGKDAVRVFDGSAWAAAAITGVSPNVLGFVWSHGKRLWFTENGRLSAWYLPPNSIGGAAVEFPLDGVFLKGGSLLFGGRWSTDAGDGLDDLMVFVTTEGEVAFYQGTDPSTAGAWSLAGVCQIGRPLSKTGWVRTGGDLLVMTEDGIVPISQALQMDRAAMQAAALTAPIEGLWQRAVARRGIAGRFSIALWSTQTLLFVGVPNEVGQPSMLVANTRTGAWGVITGWGATCLAVYGDKLYFGTEGGRVARADTGGTDLGAPYVGLYVSKAQDLGAAGRKAALMARLIWRGSPGHRPALGCCADYNAGPVPSPGMAAPPAEGVWGQAVWGTFRWRAARRAGTASLWRSVSGAGTALAPAVAIAVDQAGAPDMEIVGATLRLEAGSAP